MNTENTNTGEAPVRAPRFPVALRKMWSGGEVQDWIEAHWPREGAATESLLRTALEPFARLSAGDLSYASITYKLARDPERQTFQTPTMHRAFNRAAEVLRKHPAQAEVPAGEWENAERIRDLPAVNEAIQALIEDSTGDNAACLVREILRAGRTESAPLPPDDFKGDTPHLINCIGALLSMDKDGALVPHGIPGHARSLLAAAANRLAGRVMTIPEEEFEEGIERPHIDANALERMAKARPHECFLKGTGVLKLTGAVRQLEGQQRVALALLRECLGPLEVSSAGIESEDGGEAIETLIAQVRKFCSDATALGVRGLPAAEYLTKVKTDPRRAEALERARERIPGGAEGRTK